MPKREFDNRGMVWGAIEAGGNKFVCGVGTGPRDLRTVRIPTESPSITIAAAVEWFRAEAGAQLSAIGIGSFGPVDLDPDSPTWGHITTTPKAGWRGYDLAGTVARALGVPVAVETDVNAAALGEARWGAARGLSNFLYLTVGTGIGGGAIVDGRPLHGLSHPEMGHVRIPHDRAADPFPGCCPWHGDCLEGLASGPAIEARWGKPAAKLPADHPAWALEARYLALGLANYCCTLSPKSIVMGGGVMGQKALPALIDSELRLLVAGYLALPEVVAPALGNLSGVLGALALAESFSRQS